MKNAKDLRELIANLQYAVAQGMLTKETVELAIERLRDIENKAYDDEMFPALTGTSQFSIEIGDSPANLAEALLWKLGKWKIYKDFVSNYANADGPISTQGGIVLSAFAKHLKDSTNPIFDQHALRALWAICSGLSDDEKQKCKAWLLTRDGKWKDVGSGKEAEACYALFVKHLDIMTSTTDGPTKLQVDRLLMPLGQLIKDATKDTNISNFEAFSRLAGFV